MVLYAGTAPSQGAFLFQDRPITTPTIIPRAEHCISRAQISEFALKVLYRLRGAGYQAHLVGGGVRDLLLGRVPKDFDVATDASPEDVKQVFRNCRIIGRRFRLAHVHFGSHIIEVATFRAQASAEDDDVAHCEETGRILRDNVYGTIEQDAFRRDFTVNALFYNIEDFSVVDYVGGMDDIRSGTLRLIGDPEQRCREDPVRMLRAARFAAKLGFRVCERDEHVIHALGALLDGVPPARLFEEVLKLFLSGHALASYEMLRHYRLFEHLFPQTEAALAREEGGYPLTLVTRALANTDARVAADKPVTPVFLFAALLWEPVRFGAEALRTQGMPPVQALYEAGDAVVRRQLQTVQIPKRFTLPMQELWALQARFEQREGKRPQRLLTHPRFRAGYDLLLLRAEAGEADAELARWWTEFQTLDAGQQDEAVAPAASPARRRRRRRRRSQEGAGGGA